METAHTCYPCQHVMILPNAILAKGMLRLRAHPTLRVLRLRGPAAVQDFFRHWGYIFLQRTTRASTYRVLTRSRGYLALLARHCDTGGLQGHGQ